MKAISEFLGIAAALTVVVGFLWSDFRFRNRLEIGFFSIRKETIFWPFYYERDEWTPLLLSILLAVGLIAVASIISLFA
ncbi:MAG TPA: hypothetical protein VJ623_04935 [Holophagaceae bacterium]|nr:hypothetical protein [Holophagaceae bacterium]